MGRRVHPFFCCNVRRSRIGVRDDVVIWLMGVVVGHDRQPSYPTPSSRNFGIAKYQGSPNDGLKISYSSIARHSSTPPSKTIFHF